MIHSRLPAEWELQSGIMLVFPHPHSDWNPYLEEATACFVTLAKTIARFETCLIVCDSIPRIMPFLGDCHNMRLIELQSNDTWCRDFGPITVVQDGNPVLLDFIFNGWGNKFDASKDDAMTSQLYAKGTLGSAPLKSIDFVLEGGSIDSNGSGTVLTTSACLLEPNRNPELTQAHIEQHFNTWFGAKQILWLDNGYLAGDDTDSHIDMLARFVSPNHIVYVECTDKNDEHYDALDSMKRQLESFINPEGQPFELTPLPFPEAICKEGERLPASYANFLIINGAVLVPLYGVLQDKGAMEIFVHLFPEREVIGIDCRVLIRQHGSLHCSTMQLLGSL